MPARERLSSRRVKAHRAVLTAPSLGGGEAVLHRRVTHPPEQIAGTGLAR